MKQKKINITNIKLDEEEQEISDTLDKSQLETISEFEKEVAFAREVAANYFRKDARITLRLSSLDLDRLKCVGWARFLCPPWLIRDSR